jgi:hypothetical protein
MVPKGHAGRLAYISEFIEEAKGVRIGEEDYRRRRRARGSGRAAGKTKLKTF